MVIHYQKKFYKQFAKLDKHKQIQAKEAIERFKKNPFDPKLKNHALKGPMIPMRAFSAGFDLRIIFSEEKGYVEVLFVQIGSHNQVY
ncbi:MAG: type II toxin-antitoxin system YafQ family toxin [Magnetococcales bacterium]|nr:type II toxin-antitoxin system YafQ family toxin [Magnetococcales bacterium]